MLPEHKSDLMEFSKVSIVKFILTEGEKFIIFAFNEFVSAQHLKGVSLYPAAALYSKNLSFLLLEFGCASRIRPGF